ncbi:hypothetical protein RI129_007801 [Pyrocoelia pectoralis]|uniref:Cyclic nucleotide-binding domain-containing protein n=1 Tax=Pyrocoelia pectoralis TaxID=417401 RepID=A0AAN7ZN48_9COLE
MGRTTSELVIMTPEQIQAKQFRAKCRFRALVRKVIRNLYWLDDIEDQDLSDNVTKNIYLLTRRKHANALSLTDKSILCTPVSKRTDMDKAHLYRAIGGLKCFRRYPTHVKAQLAAVTYFQYLGPGRVIYRENHAALALYFVISGEISLSQLVYDPVLDKSVNQEIARRGPGAVLGEISLLHNMPQAVTVTTNTHTELLRLRKDDFNIVLKATVQKQWLRVQQALDMFTYFQSWNDMTKRDCCILAKMLSFKPDETILGDGVGLNDFVYFVIKGQCRIIQHLYTTHYTKNGRVFYEICQPLIGNDDLHEDSKMNFKSTSNTYQSSQWDIPGKGATVMSYDIICSISYNSKIISFIIRLSRTDIAEEVAHTASMHFAPNAELHFMQVCILNTTACFCIGEQFENRRVLAMNDVECLLIPQYWIMQKNVGNIWNRVKQYLNSHIPSTRQVQEEFLKERRWYQHKKETTGALLAKKQSVNHALMCDVPLFIRMNEKIDM